MKYVLAGLGCTVLLAAFFWMQKQSDVQPALEQNNYKLVKKNCWFDVPWPRTITCGDLHTPINSGSFILPVVIIQDDSANHQPDPLVYLAGGPGASSRLHAEGINEWLNWMTYANLGRDLILMDPRGTGRASPQLQCAAFNRFNQALLRLHLPLVEELEQSFRITKRCFEQLAETKTPIKTEYFGSVQSAADVRGLIAQLDYTHWNVLGVSYGTRLALEIARQEITAPQPARLRSMVLDSVYPAGFGGVQTWPQVLDDAFQNFFRQCATREACIKPLQALQYQSLADLFIQTLHVLQQEPQELTIRRWDGEVPVNFLVNDHRFVSASFAAIYDPERWPDITAAIYAVHHHQPEDLKPLVEPFINNSFSPDFNSLAFMAVDCADNPVMAEQDYLASVDIFPLLGDYTKDQWRYQICQVLPGNKNSFLSLIKPQVPTLMLSGKLDPITPVGWAEDLKTRWPEVQILVREKIAHAVLGSDPCVLAHIGEFFNNPTHPFVVCTSDDKNTLVVK